MKQVLYDDDTIQDIKRSWKRCAKNGLAHENAVMQKTVSSQIWRRERALFGDTVVQSSIIPLLDKLSEQLLAKHAFLLITKRSVIILERGTIANFRERVFSDSNILSERTCGTLAILRCLKTGRPAFLWGSDHYLDCLKPYIEVTAPITDGSGAVIACLALFVESLQAEEDINDSPLARAVYKACVLCARLITEGNLNQHKKQRLNSQISLANKRVLGASTLIDEAIVIVNKAGRIVRLDGDARRVFQIISDDDPPLTLQDFMIGNPSLATRILKGEYLSNVNAKLGIGDNQRQFLVSAHPVTDDNMGGIQVSVILLAHDGDIHASRTPEQDSSLSVSFDEMIGSAPSFLQAKKKAIAMSSSMARILLRGDIGTGKETFARAIHALHSPDAPFVSRNCATLAYQSPEIVLFGRKEKQRTQIGLLEQAHNGTLFLDNIEDLPLSIQPLFLRVLEDYQVTRIGDMIMRPANFKLIAASKRNIAELVKEGSFRRDLYYRITTAEIELSPLRERKRDIMPLAERFIADYQEELKIPPITYANEVADILINHTWPGNIRELRAVVKSACYICKNNHIMVSDLPDELLYATGQMSHDIRREGLSLAESRHQHILDALQASDNNISKAARMLGMGRSTLYRYLNDFKTLQSTDGTR